MKIRFLLLVALFTGLTTVVFAQNVSVTPRKVTYKRPKPISDYKKTFVVNFPKVRGLSPALTKKVENTLSYERVFNFKINDEIREVQWLEEADFQVDYNKNGILGMMLWLEGSGAYPSGTTEPVVINLKTGNRIRPQEVFIKLPELTAAARNKQKAEIKQAIADIKKNDPEEENPARLFENAKFNLSNLDDFSINDQGVTFWYNYNFPHVIRALEPEGRFFFSWAELKPYINRGSLFGQFVR